MTNKVVKALASSGLFAVLSVALIGFSMTGSPTVSAQSPPNPPAAFHGDVEVDGDPVPAGTLIEAVIDGEVCGDARTGEAGSAGSSSYYVYVEAMAPAAPDCGTAGETVVFYIGGEATGRVGGSGTWNNSLAQRVDLSYTTPATATATTTTGTGTATATTTGTGGTPGTGTPGTGTGGTAVKTNTPKAPGTGLGTTAEGDGSATWLFAAIGLGAIAFGASGVAVARRSR